MRCENCGHRFNEGEDLVAVPMRCCIVRGTRAEWTDTERILCVPCSEEGAERG